MIFVIMTLHKKSFAKELNEKNRSKKKFKIIVCLKSRNIGSNIAHRSRVLHELLNHWIYGCAMAVPTLVYHLNLMPTTVSYYSNNK